MTNKIKNFFKLIYFEIKKLQRSPIIFSFILFAPILFSIIFCGYVYNIGTMFNNTSPEYLSAHAEYVQIGTGDISATEDKLKEIIDIDEIQWKNDLEQSFYNLKTEKIYLVISVNTNTQPNEITIYYNSNSKISSTLVKSVSELQDKYSYIAIKDYLDDYGVTIDDRYFKLAQYNNITTQNNYTTVFISILTFAIAFVIVLGIAYSSARDNETGIIKQLSYTPMSAKKYLFIRICFYMILSLLQTCVSLLIFSLFGMKLNCSIIGFIGLTMLYILAFIMMTLLFSNTKNQISSISLCLLFIIIPICLNLVVPISSLSIFFQAILLISPVTVLMEFFNIYAFFGIIEIKWIIILLAEIIIYFWLTLLILRKRTGQEKIKKAK